MPSKLRRAINAVKDHTSISLAFVSGSSDINLAVLRSTSHDQSISSEEGIAEFLLLASSSPEPAVRALCRRLSRTRNWVVAVKSLLLISRAISDAGPDFRHEALVAVSADGRRRLLDFSGFRDESELSSPWDFSAFVRSFALYLSARLEAFAAGNMMRRQRRINVSSLKPTVLVYRIRSWQCLLNRAMGCRPTGLARAQHLIRVVFHSVVRESFELYRDIADGISYLLDSFLQLPIDMWPHVFQASQASAKQFEELELFYNGCKKMGIGRLSEYPSVRKISDSLLQTLERFLSDGEAAKNKSLSKKLVLVPAMEQRDLTEPESWEVALLESVNDLNIICQEETTKVKELVVLNQQSPRKKHAFFSSLQNPFLLAANDKSLMAVTPSQPTLRALSLQKECIMKTAKDQATMMTPSRFGLGDYRGQRRDKEGEKEGNKHLLDEFTSRKRLPLRCLGERNFYKQYHMQMQWSKKAR